MNNHIIDPQVQLQEISVQVQELQDQAQHISIQSDYDVAMATELLTQVKGRSKAIENLRVLIVQPLNDQVKKINNMFKSQIEPLDRIEADVKRAIVVYRSMQEAILKNEQDRLEKERRDEMERLERERIAAAEANAPLEEIQAIEAKQEDVALKPVTIEPMHTSVRSTSGSMSAKKIWKFELTDGEQVPREYMMVNETAIRRAILDGVREIPGVRIYQEESISIR